MLLTSIFPLAALLIGCGGSSGSVASASSASSSSSAAPAQRIVFNPDSALQLVNDQCAFGARVPGSAEHRACGDFLEARMRTLADNVIVQQGETNNYRGGTTPVRNIIGQFNVDAPNRMLLLAHWDSRPWADSDPDEANHATPVMGANDGASGVAVLLEIARLLHSNPVKNTGIDILLVDAEDAGVNGGDERSWCLGTQYWIEHQHTSHRPTVGILLDMVGGKNAKFTLEMWSMKYAQQWIRSIWDTARRSGYDNYFVNTQIGAITDDHIFLNAAGIPCIDIIDLRENSETGFIETWHTTGDTPDAIEPATLKAVGQTLINFLFE